MAGFEWRCPLPGGVIIAEDAIANPRRYTELSRLGPPGGDTVGLGKAKALLVDSITYIQSIHIITNQKDAASCEAFSDTRERRMPMRCHIQLDEMHLPSFH